MIRIEKSGLNIRQEPVIIRVTKEYHIPNTRHSARLLAEAIGFRQVIVYYIMTSVSELAYNLFFHTDKGGTITLAPLIQKNNAGIEIIAKDKGPGIADIDLALTDGFSTNKGLGGGLPGVKRLMDEFEIYTKIGQGTQVIARKWQKWT
jgi:serine/threonine-protein kinase RsbT